MISLDNVLKEIGYLGLRMFVFKKGFNDSGLSGPYGHTTYYISLRGHLES